MAVVYVCMRMTARRHLRTLAAIFAAVLAFVSVTHAAMHPSPGDAVACAVCESPSETVATAAPVAPLDAAPRAVSLALAKAPTLALLDAAVARGPPRS